MTDYERVSIGLAVVIGVIASATLIVYYHQLRVMSRQLSAMQQGSRAQNGLAVVAFLQTSETREARQQVREVLSVKPISEWTVEDRKAAAHVAANFDVVAALLRANLASVDLIADNWGPSIAHCHSVLRPFIAQQRARPGGSPDYWNNFDWLEARAARPIG